MAAPEPASNTDSMGTLLNRSGLEHAALNLARVGVVGMALSMPFARAAFNLCALLMIIGWLFSGQWRQKFSDIGHSGPAVACIGFFAISLLSLANSDVLGQDEWDALKGYSRLLYVPLIVSLITTAEWQRRAWTAMLLGMLFTLSIFLLDIWFEIPGTRTYGSGTAGQGVFHHHIAEGMVLAFLGACALHKALQAHESRTHRAFWLLICIGVLAGIFSVGQSRTGQFSVLVAYTLVLATHLPKPYRLRALGLSLLAAFLLIAASPRVQERFAEGLRETATFQIDGERTSVGARLKAWEFSFELIEQAPWLGHGVGSYRDLAYQHFRASRICDLGVCEQPHNQFIVTTVEMGILGLLSLFSIILAGLLQRPGELWATSRLLPAFMAIFTLTALMDSSLKIQAQSFFSVMALGLLSSSIHKKYPSAIKLQ